MPFFARLKMRKKLSVFPIIHTLAVASTSFSLKDADWSCRPPKKKCGWKLFKMDRWDFRLSEPAALQGQNRTRRCQFCSLRHKFCHKFCDHWVLAASSMADLFVLLDIKEKQHFSIWVMPHFSSATMWSFLNSSVSWTNDVGFTLEFYLDYVK